MATKISRAGSSGNNDERTAESSGRSGRVIQPWWNIVANAAIRTRTNEEGDLQNQKASASGCPVRQPREAAHGVAARLKPPGAASLPQRPQVIGGGPRAADSWKQ